jgi:hypothetical protein
MKTRLRRVGLSAGSSSFYIVEPLEERQLLSVSMGAIEFDDSTAPMLIYQNFSGGQLDSGSVSGTDLILER